MQGTTEGIEQLGAGETVKGIEFLGVRWIGLNPTNGQKLLATIALIVIMLLLAALLRWVIHRCSRGRTNISWITAAKQVVNPHGKLAGVSHVIAEELFLPYPLLIKESQATPGVGSLNR